MPRATAAQSTNSINVNPLLLISSPFKFPHRVNSYIEHVTANFTALLGSSTMVQNDDELRVI
jgi:hypothetical protein